MEVGDSYEMSQLLLGDEYKFWLEALENDDFSTVESTLSESEPTERQLLLNGRFNVEKISSRTVVGDRGRDCVRLTRPWNICAARGSHAAMTVMLSYGVDVHQKDDRNNNVLHTLVLVAYLEPTLEAKMEETYSYVEKLLDKGTLKELLFSENHHNYRPLELAARLGAFRLLTAIYETKEIYVFPENINWLYSVNWYDVSDYEGIGSGTRWLVSPLLLLMLIDKTKVSERNTAECFASPLLTNWAELKMKSNWNVIALWFLVRLIFNISYVIADQMHIPAKHFNTGNDTLPTAAISICTMRNGYFTDQTTVYIVIHLYLALHSMAIIVFDIAECIFFFTRKIYTIAKTPKGYKPLAVVYGFYRILQFLTGVLVLTSEVSNFTTQVFGRGLPLTLRNLVYIGISIGQTWSILFFVQLVPWIGHFVQAVQSMVMKLSRFFIVFSLLAVPFVAVFRHFIIDSQTKNCPDEFRTAGSSFYSLFMVFLNMINFRRFSVANPLVLYFLHTVYVFMTNIMLINLLIATFATSFSHVYDNRHLLSMIQRMSVVWLIERRISRCPSSFLHSWYSRRHRRYFTMKDGRIMVPCITFNKNLLKKANEERVLSPTVWAKKKRQFTPYLIR